MRLLVSLAWLAVGVVFWAGPVVATEERAEEGVELTEPELSIARGMEGLKLMTQIHDETWQISEAAWAVDMDAGTIEFRNGKGWIITAPVQVIGTYDTLDGTFMWGWDHPSVPEHAAKSAQKVREFGLKHGLPEVSELVVEIDEDQAWKMTGLASYLAEEQGAYRGPAGTTYVYMTFGKVTISKP